MKYRYKSIGKYIIARYSPHIDLNSKEERSQEESRGRDQISSSYVEMISSYFQFYF